MTATTTIRVPGEHLMGLLLGEHDQHLRRIESAFPKLDIVVRGNEVHLRGDETAEAVTLFEELVVLAEQGQHLDRPTLSRVIDMVRADERPSSVLSQEVLRVDHSRSVRPKSVGQKNYVDAIAANVVTFGIGPAGTGKSWLAVAMAMRSLHAGEVERIVLTRPAVEAGEQLGFLPGDVLAKVDPYLRPLYDALRDMAGTESMESLLERGIVEVAPLAFMRGRTLNASFIICDEAQNTTPRQMKMFLTRIGFGSKAVVTGDITQIDVKDGSSGLVGLEKILGGIDGVGFVRLTGRDVVRHRIVQDIVDAYSVVEAQGAEMVDAQRGEPPS